ncbi:MAG: hypothetical protein KF819_34635 [Labilithrix sp.]|nr:hypothetical protein [Labilithrix sp.]
MGYRDDREALHNRVAQLEEELEAARREGEQKGRDAAQEHAAALEKRIGEMRAELERVELELDAIRGKAPKARAAGTRAALLGGVVAAGMFGGITVVLVARSDSERPTVVTPAPVPVTPPEVPRTVTPPAPVPPPAPEAPPAARERRTTTAKWTASATRVEGLPIAPGAACTVEATIWTTETNTGVSLLTVMCGAHKLYRSSDSLNGMSQSMNDARERLGPKDDKSAFTLKYRDVGSRTGERTQIDLDTTLAQASVFKETLPRFRVDLSIPAASAEAAALAGPEQRLRRTGKVAEARGLEAGAACTLRAMPTGRQQDCVAEIACGGRVVWPPSEPVTCTYDGARPASVTAEGASTLAIEGSKLTLKRGAVSATLALDEP